MSGVLKSAAIYFKKHGIKAFVLRVAQQLKPEVIDRHAIDEVGIAAKALRLNKKTPGLMIDVGAHYGQACRQFCEAGWTVYAFEPDSLNRQHLLMNNGHFPNLKIDSRAISDQEKDEVTFYRSAQSTGISGLSAFHASHAAADTVAVTTLAKVVEENRIPKIDFLKIDTEGFDKFVLQGVPWASHPPLVIVAEFEDFKTKPLGYDFDDFATYLVSKGYQVMVSEWAPIVAYGTSHEWADFKQYPCQLNSERAWGNFVASKDPAIFQRIVKECDRIKRRVH